MIKEHGINHVNLLKKTIKNEQEEYQKEGIKWEDFGFQLTKTNYMYISETSLGTEFHNGKIVPYGPLSLEPAATVLNYGQGLFEGIKGILTRKGRVVIFRPDENASRMRNGGARFLISDLPHDVFIDGITSCTRENCEWVPPCGLGSFYLRPILFGSAPALGVAPSTRYTFCVYGSPVGNYFKGDTAIHLHAVTDFHRAAKNGTGYVKAIGNYAPAFFSQKKSKQAGFAEVLFLDAVHARYLEEAGASNVFIVSKDGRKLSTPHLNGNILPGITRQTVIILARELGYTVEERYIDIQELTQDSSEAFCTGTGASITPVGAVTHGDETFVLGDGKPGKVTIELRKAILDIQYEIVEDKHGWLMDVYPNVGSM